jgi:hypothetical protein
MNKDVRWTTPKLLGFICVEGSDSQQHNLPWCANKGRQAVALQEHKDEGDR